MDIFNYDYITSMRVVSVIHDKEYGDIYNLNIGDGYTLQLTECVYNLYKMLYDLSSLLKKEQMINLINGIISTYRDISTMEFEITKTYPDILTIKKKK